MAGYDFLIIGAGIAGASAAFELGRHGRVLLLEREERPDYHATGRSTATFVESYGNSVVRALTRASRRFYESPPDGFADQPLLSPRGCLYVGREDQQDSLDKLLSRKGKPDLTAIDRGDAMSMVPILNAEHLSRAVLEPDAMDLNVNAIHQGYLRGHKAAGGDTIMRAGVRGLSFQEGRWVVKTAAGEFFAPVVVNAAGAWCDEIAEMAGVPPIGLIARRRTVISVPQPPNLGCDTWPLVRDVDEEFYFKPSSGRLLITPADEMRLPPSDVQPDEMDIALAVDRFERHTTAKVDKIEQRWAGLRTFALDNSPVVGPDQSAQGFFWLAGQGGYGFQTAPALAAITASLLAGTSFPAEFQALGVSHEAVAPGRMF